MLHYTRHWFILLLLFLRQMNADTKNKASCPRPIVGTCSCDWIGPYAKVTCRGLDTLPRKLPENTTNLQITHGNIQEIPENYFLPLEYLQSLELHNNKISTPFHLPKQIWSLNLGSNMLNSSSVHGMFDGLVKLRKLDLSFNPMNGSILPGTFSSLSQLGDLLLRNCQLKEIREGTFSGLIRLHRLNLRANNLQFLNKGVFKGLQGRQEAPLSLILTSNEIEYIEDGTFKDVKSITRLFLTDNKLSTLPDLRGISEKNSILKFDINGIRNISSLTNSGLKTITELLLYDNRVSAIPLFKDLRILEEMNFGRNQIKELPSRFLENSPTLNMLILNNNQIDKIHKDSFQGLNDMQDLYLFNNQIKQLPDAVFANLTLKNLFLNGNRLKNLTGRPFKGMKKTKTAIYLFGNEIEHIGDEFLNDLGNETMIDFRCKSLKELPHIHQPSISRITCTPNQLDWIRGLNDEVAFSLTASGFFCNKIDHNNWNCRPCNVGSFQTRQRDNKPCKRCSAGGFYQDQMAQTTCKECNMGTYVHPNNTPGTTPLSCQACPQGPSTREMYHNAVWARMSTQTTHRVLHHYRVRPVHKGDVPQCSMGTYVHPNNTPGTTPLSCQACPQGTQTSEKAGYRACKCFQNFYRFDRFGRCFPCPNKAYKCENDYASLSAGFYWRWENSTREKQYREFIANLMVENPEFAEGTWKYEGTLPNPHKCPRDSCLGGLDSSCQDGYRGSLCALCQQDYYNRMNRCIRCPSRLWAGFQVAIVIVLFVFVLLALLWGDRKRLQNENGRTMADKILSCFKIVIGFYQVMAGVYSAFSNITWPSSVIWMQKTLHFIQLNILQIAPLSCITPRLSFNVLQQFVIVVVLNITVVTFILIYLVIRIAVLKRKKSYSPNQIDESVAKTKSSCIRNICVFLFATYPKTCTSIIQVLSINCVQLCFSEKHAHCDSYLRSDLSVQCHTPEHTIISRIATAFLVYPIGFPVAILILVWKYIHKPESEDQNSSEERDTPAVDAFRFTPLPRESPFKSGLSLFSENYRPNCWYWESLEMIRKLVLISGLTLIGEHSRTQIGLGAIISAVFAILYVYKRPITNKFENLLQTVALMAIFLNLGIGVMLKASDNDNMSPVINKHNDNLGVSIMMIIINVAVIGIVTVAVLKVIIMQTVKCCRSAHEENCSCGHCCKACLTCCLSLLLPCKLGSGILTHDDESRNTLLQHARNA